MTDRDIVDEIDALVEDQLDQEASGYDHNINQVACPHSWCDADFHGLPIKRRMQQMRNYDGSVDPEYVYADDDSPIICPGSLFEGEFTPPVSYQPQPPASRPYTLGMLTELRAEMASRNPYGRPIYGPAQTAVREVLLRSQLGAWPIPDDPLADGEPLGWQALGYDDGGMISGPRPVDPDQQLVRFDTTRTQSWTITPGEVNPEVLGLFMGRSPILDMDTVRELRNMRYRAEWPRERDEFDTEDLTTQILSRFAYEASRALNIGCVNHYDILIEANPEPHPFNPEMTVWEARWQPDVREVEFLGGPANGQVREVRDEAAARRIVVPVPTRHRYEDFNPENPVASFQTVDYVRAGWNTETRRWVYRPERSEDMAAFDMVVAGSRQAAQRHAAYLRIRDAHLVSELQDLRGINLKLFRVHCAGPVRGGQWQRGVRDRLFELASIAGRPIESFIVEPDAT